VPTSVLDDVGRTAQPFGLALRGGFHPEPADGVPAMRDGRTCASLVLLGNIGASIWPAFSSALEKSDGEPHALDRWTRRVINAIAAEVGAEALYPFGRRPWLPFQRWAQRAEPVTPSAIGILIHPDHGLWHAYRGALVFADSLDLPAMKPRARPCDSCADRPCLTACPVGAFKPKGYDVAACRDHVASAKGLSCREGGCLARLACPVGRELVYPPAEMGFHMAAFLSAR
jgi:ferredoxin-like protein FixX